ncbi:TonB-dependent receptor, partial [bacterium]|nr:TonB-dependent receptor [bacterium]
LPFAAIEDRARLMIDVESGKLDFNLTTTLVGGRDLAPYGYGNNRYNVWDGATASVPKMTQVPAFMTMDARLSYEVAKDWKIYGGVKNLWNYTQASTENALFYDDQGNYDVIHLWGPLRGREVYVGLSAKL